MTVRHLPAWLAAMCAIAAISIASLTAQGTSQPLPRRILFVGDSFTYAQNGLDTHVVQLAASARPPIAVAADRSAFGGAFLHRLWDRPEPLKAINTGTYDVVVLQEDIPETTVADFREYARKFVAEVRKNRARPVLLMAWDYQRLGWISMAEIAQAHRDAAKELDVDVAPVGLAWKEAAKQRQSMRFYAADLEHPNVLGMYLEACVAYATIYNRDPGGLAYAPAAVAPADAAFLQKVAWQVVQDYRAGRL